MKIQGTLNINNKKSEEITKWTTSMFWFIIFTVKIVIVGLMINTVTTQIKISKLMVDNNCYIDKVVIIFTVFSRFLNECKGKLELLLYFLMLEVLQEVLVISGYLIIWVQNMKQEMLLEKYLQRIQEEEEEKKKKKDSEKEKLL